MSYTEMPGSPPPKPLYASPPALAGPRRIEYMRSFHYIFENPSWMTNTLLIMAAVVLAGMVPGVGIVLYIPLLGYLFLVVETLLVNGGQRYPDVDTNQLERYFYRGLWPFLVNMVLSLAMMVIIVPVFMIGFGLMMAVASAGGEEGAVALVILLPLMFIGFMALTVALGIVMMPFILRAGLTQDFGQAFDWAWARDFIRRMWLDMLLANLFLIAASLLLTFAGLLVFCVGAYFANAIVFLAWAHMLYQIYALYLSRGGTPIPLKPEPPTAVMAPPPQW